MVQLANVTWSKEVGRKNAFFKEHTKRELIADLSGNVHFKVELFWSCVQNARILKIAQYTNKMGNRQARYQNFGAVFAQRLRCRRDFRVAFMVPTTEKSSL